MGRILEKRIAFLVEVAGQVAATVGGERVGMRLSPYGTNAGMGAYPGIDRTYERLVAALVGTNLQYLHLADHSSPGAPPVPLALKLALRKAWPRTLILAGGFDGASAQAALGEGEADLIALGRPFLANPDLVSQLQRGLPLNVPDPATFYTAGPRGYTDYPAAA